jgi:hypothetical protein
MPPKKTGRETGRKVGRPRTRAPGARISSVVVEALSPEERAEWHAVADRVQIDGRNATGLGPLMAHLMRQFCKNYKTL